MLTRKQSLRKRSYVLKGQSQLWTSRVWLLRLHCNKFEHDSSIIFILAFLLCHGPLAHEPELTLHNLLDIAGEMQSDFPGYHVKALTGSLFYRGSKLLWPNYLEASSYGMRWKVDREKARDNRKRKRCLQNCNFVYLGKAKLFPVNLVQIC